MYEIKPSQNINFRATGIERILQNVSNLLSIIKGEIPLGRDIGISSSLTDKHTEELKPEYIKEVIDLIETKEPRVKVLEIKLETNGIGEIVPKVKVSINE